MKWDEITYTLLKPYERKYKKPLENVRVVSDTHGSPDYWKALEDAQKARSLIIHLGDVIDRGPQSVEILQENIKNPYVLQLLGNHESMFLNFVDAVLEYAYEHEIEIENDAERFWDTADNAYLDETKQWVMNGGGVTISGLMKLSYKELMEIYHYLMQCPLSVELTVNNKEYYLVHGRPGNNWEKLWGEVKAGDIFFRGKKATVFGHVPTIVYDPSKKEPEIYREEHIIGIDTAAGFPDFHGRVSMLQLDDLKEYYY